eukprot:NODE_20471_length_796_cov_8.789238.p1 GENE.NODE_20471_length_796_cov_8.789238~~NODE_20471_length_796_cov_8.789238.p1  ORF type:complete len:212 (-),score=68.40 NODE_20471_length_796_cov_8.789238:27-662(-)
MSIHMKKSAQLLKDLQRAVWLPAYNDKVIKEVLEEIFNDTKDMKSLVSEHQDLSYLPQEVTAGLCLYNDLVDRNRRCLLAYLNYRLEKVEELRWEVGLMVPAEKWVKLHESEKQFLHLYNGCLDRYMKKYTPACKEPLDLTADARAPQDLNVQIRVHDDAVGDIHTIDSGVVRFRQGWVHTVRRTDVEHLIRAGLVEHVRTLRIDDMGGGA